MAADGTAHAPCALVVLQRQRAPLAREPQVEHGRRGAAAACLAGHVVDDSVHELRLDLEAGAFGGPSTTRRSSARVIGPRRA